MKITIILLVIGHLEQTNYSQLTKKLITHSNIKQIITKKTNKKKNKANETNLYFHRVSNRHLHPINQGRVTLCY